MYSENRPTLPYIGQNFIQEIVPLDISLRKTSSNVEFQKSISTPTYGYDAKLVSETFCC